MPLNEPTVQVRDKPVLYLPDGREVSIYKPFGFAKHPAVQEQNNKEKR